MTTSFNLVLFNKLTMLDIILNPEAPYNLDIYRFYELIPIAKAMIGSNNHTHIAIGNMFIENYYVYLANKCMNYHEFWVIYVIPLLFENNMEQVLIGRPFYWNGKIAMPIKFNPHSIKAITTDGDIIYTNKNYVYQVFIKRKTFFEMLMEKDPVSFNIYFGKPTVNVVPVPPIFIPYQQPSVLLPTNMFTGTTNTRQVNVVLEQNPGIIWFRLPPNPYFDEQSGKHFDHLC